MADAILMGKMSSLLEAHAKWGRGDGGSRADLSGADLSGADLYGANLSRANLSGADLSRADLSRADLSGANLSRADLSRANLSRADLSGADLYGANLSRANLSGANLYRANLSRANLYGADLSRANLYGADLSRADNLAEAKGLDPLPFGPVTLPDWTFRAYKLCRGLAGERVIVTLEIPEDAQRVAPLVGRKCRATHAKVVAMSEGSVAKSWHSPPFPAQRITYRVGETVRADIWDPSPFVECSGGIHFFISRREAEEHS